MIKKDLRIFYGLTFACLFVIAACASQSAQQTDSLVDSLKHGGYVIVFRHAATDHSQKDTDIEHPANCEAQRHLSDKGKQQAREIGEGFGKFNIPLGDVITSQYCRCSNTAKIAFGRAETTLEITSIQGVSVEERQRRIANVRNMINVIPKANSNTVLVTHNWMIKEATGQSLEEGEAAIFLPQPGGIARLIKRVKPEEWKNLDSVASVAPSGS